MRARQSRRRAGAAAGREPRVRLDEARGGELQIGLGVDEEEHGQWPCRTRSSPLPLRDRVGPSGARDRVRGIFQVHAL